MEQMINAYKILVWKYDGKNHLEDLDREGRILYKYLTEGDEINYLEDVDRDGKIASNILLKGSINTTRKTKA
jgi:hypothetical protein